MTAGKLIGHASHLARRGAAQFSDAVPEETLRQWHKIIKEIPSGGIIVLFLTVVGFAILILLVDYMFEVVFRIAAVETPKQDFLIKDMHVSSSKPYKDSDAAGASDDDEEEEEEDIDLEMPMAPQKPITAGIRSTLRHIVSIGGRKARFRGIALAIVYFLCYTFLTGILGILTPLVAAILVRTLLSTWEMGWTHIVITQPSSDPWYRRMPPFKALRKIAGPTALAAFIMQIAVLIPVLLFFGLNLHSVDKFNAGSSDLTGIKMMLVALVFCISIFLIAVPAEMALARVQASMLPNTEETIVPMDRTFGGRAIPEHEGGKGKLSLLEAWRSYDSGSFRRMVKLILKMAGFQFLMQIAFILVLVGEAWVFVVPAMRRVLKDKSPSDDPTPSI